MTSPPSGAAERGQQLEYSSQQPLMLDERSRRRKAAKMISVIEHFLGRTDLQGVVAVDIGCSAGIISDELHRAGASVTGIDIDVPGIERATARFATDGLRFVPYSGEALPLPDGSVELVVCNHVYEHTVDPDQLMAEIRRVLTPDGVAYLGLGNRLGVMEPHYRLPFLSWLPRRWADVYIRRAGRADRYYERFKTRRGLRRMCAGFTVWDYTFSVLAEPERFAASDMVRGPVRLVPLPVWRLLTQLIPTYIWIGSRAGGPRGPQLRSAPRPVVAGGPGRLG